MAPVRFLGIVALFAVSVGVGAADHETYVLCKNQKNVRTLRISKRKDATCEVIYAKEGRDKIVGSARAPASCGQVLGNIQKNLSEAGWKCRDISSTATVVETKQD